MTTLDRVLGAVVITLAAALAVVLECFYVNLRVGTVPIPIAQVAALVLNGLTPWAALRLTGRLGIAAAPSIVWLVVAVALSTAGPGGDVVIPGNWQGLTFLGLGMLGVVSGYMIMLQRTAPTTHTRPRAAARR